MFLQLNHQKLDVYNFSKSLVFECYMLTKIFPSDEKFSMSSQIRRAALSAHLNIAEGSSRKSELERKRYYEIARGSVIEIDAALDVAKDLGYIQNIQTDKLGECIIRTFKILTGLILSKAN
jgi:four helix bundle protein